MNGISISFPRTFRGHAAAGEDLCVTHRLSLIDRFTLEVDRPCTVKINDDVPVSLGEKNKKPWRMQSGGKVQTPSRVYGNVDHIVVMSECDYVLECSTCDLKR